MYCSEQILQRERVSKRDDRSNLFYIFMNYLRLSSFFSEHICSIFTIIPIHFIYYHPHLSSTNPFLLFFLLLETLALTGDPSNHPRTTHQNQPTAFIRPPLPSLGQRSRYNSTEHSTTVPRFQLPTLFSPFSSKVPKGH